MLICSACRVRGGGAHKCACADADAKADDELFRAWNKEIAEEHRVLYQRFEGRGTGNEIPADTHYIMCSPEGRH